MVKLIHLYIILLFPSDMMDKSSNTSATSHMAIKAPTTFNLATLPFQLVRVHSELPVIHNNDGHKSNKVKCNQMKSLYFLVKTKLGGDIYHGGDQGVIDPLSGVVMERHLHRP